MASKIPVRLHPLAEQEALAAFRWYEERNALVAKILLIEFEAAMGLIAESPNRWPRIGGRYRRFVLGRFPFSIVYMLRDECVEVIALAHHRRRPGDSKPAAGRSAIRLSSSVSRSRRLRSWSSAWR